MRHYTSAITLPLCCLSSSVLLFVGCVNSDAPPPVNVGDMNSSTGDMPSSMDMPPDIQEDMLVTIDMPDLAVDSGPPMLCAPTAKECTGETSTRVCDDEGMSWVEMPCEEGDICEDGDCVMGPICTPGEATCLDASNRQVCRPGGVMFGVEACEAGTSCIDGTCLSGALNGTLCDAHDDCAGNKCHCGSMTAESCSDAFATPAYCTAPCTSNTDCSESEWCFSSQVHLITSQVANYNHCVPRCQGACAETELACQYIPTVDTPGVAAWAQGCYFKQVKEVGEPCDSDVECLGGYCLKDYFSTGLCSIRCEQTGCPENAACVELIAGEKWCTPTCGDGISPSGVCPLDEPEDRLDVTCAYRQKNEGGSARVCVSTSAP